LTDPGAPIERVFTDIDGTPYALLRVPETLAGGSNMTFTTTYETTSSSQTGPELKSNLAQDLSQINASSIIAQYCAPSGTWMTQDPQIRVKALELAGNKTKVLDIVNALIGFFRSNVTYDSSSELPKYPNDTLASLRGDCDDQSILLITMCRILGIPAYLQLGCILKPDLNSDETDWNGHIMFHSESIGWHAWSMVFIPPWDWLPVDLTYVTDRTGLIPEIMHPAIYQDYTMLLQNISNFDYLGDSRTTWTRLVNSSLYIYVEDKAVEMSSQNPSFPWRLLLPLLAAFSIALILIYRWKRVPVTNAGERALVSGHSRNIIAVEVGAKAEVESAARMVVFSCGASRP
jgi:hypothetical protein